MIEQSLKQQAERWIANDVDLNTQTELRQVLEHGDAVDLADRMAGPLEFGTAGLRGILGAGPNRMNRAVVISTTAGLAQYLLGKFPNAKVRGVVIGYDARRMSREFALEAASVLAAQGIVAHLFPQLCSTPQTAYATKTLGAVAGVMVTASHNPPEYNGYKVYWENGAQIIPPHDKGISACIATIEAACQVARMPLEEAREKGLVREICPGLTDQYLQRIGKLSLHNKGRDALRIVYTPLHGVGNETARAALAHAGFGNVTSVPSQAEPDGEFPTVRFPNPEEPGALDQSYALAKELDANIIIANDPDADRLSVAVPAKDRSRFIQLTGNQVGALFGYYLLTSNPNPAPDRLVVTTIVSSPMLGVMAKELGARYEETLTGFKWIANRALEVEKQTGTTFVFGYEEALGYTVSDVVRDKDGVGAAAVFAELAAQCYAEGRTIWDELERMYRRFGLFVSSQKSITRKGLDGLAQIANTMAELRANPPKKIGPLAVVALRDYQTSIKTQADGTKEPLTLPKSNVLCFDLEGGSRVVARPSGTEPKIKFYFDVREPVTQDEPFEKAEVRAQEKLRQLEESFVALVG